MGFRDPSHVASTIRAWHHGHIRATRSTRARELLTELTPSILASFANQPDKDRAFALFDELITSLPAGVQLFSLFHANPGLLELVSDLIGAAPRLIKLLSSSTDLFEAMLTPDFFDSLPSAEDLAQEYRGRIGDARDRQDVFDISRLWAHARQFQAGLQLFLGLADIRRVAQTLTSIAELMIQRMLHEAHEWLEEQHGSMPGGRFVVLGMGKLGSRELSIGSDLDLVFVYDADEQARSDGDRPLAASTYYARLGQRLVTALSARTAEGRLYEIDTRLRPSGNAGPVACSLSNFRRYQQITAETWERQALTRARPVAGPDDLAADVMTAIDGAVTGPHAIDRLKDDIRAMRMRIFKEHGSDVIWNLKHVRGGIVELEFIAQYLQLAFAHDHPALRQTSTAAVLDAARAGGLITAEWRTALMTGLDLMQALLGVLRLSMTEDREVREISAGLQEALVRAATQALSGQPIGNFQGLEALLVETQQTARQIFDTLCPEAAPDDLQADHS
jgi:glutamate-ammonia-ligase adenylyltransferase